MIAAAYFSSPPRISKAKHEFHKTLESLRCLGVVELGTLCAAAHNFPGSAHNLGTGPRPMGGER